MTKTTAVRIVSKKGGTGKTTLAINFAAALAVRGKKVLLDDGDVANASASIQLGFARRSHASMDVLYEEEVIKDALLTYSDAGFDILPGTGYTTFAQPPTEQQIRHLGMTLTSLDYDFVVIDSAPGFFMPQIATYYKEAIIVSTVEEPSVISALELAKMYEKIAVSTHLALNRVGDNDYDTVLGIERAYGKKAIAVIPDDDTVPRSIKAHKPAYMLDRNSKFSNAIDRLVDIYLKR